MRTILCTTLAWLVLTSSAAAAPPANTGAAGSRCKASYVAGDPDPTLDSTSLGSSAPAGYEIGRASRGSVQRVMLLIHGGGWYKVGQGALNAEHDAAAAWRAAAWETVNLDYRACRNSARDVVKLYDLIRAQVGSDVPICVQGESAGAHLALLLAAHRSGVACVIAYAAPTDLNRIASQGSGGSYVRGMARAAFGADRITRVSPVAQAPQIKARLLLANAADDTMVPAAQATALADAVRAASPSAYVDVDLLEPGQMGFVHGTASAAALVQLRSRVAQVVAPYGAAPTIRLPIASGPWLLRRRV